MIDLLKPALRRALWALAALLCPLLGTAQPTGPAVFGPGFSDFGPPGSTFALFVFGRCLEVNEPQLNLDGARVQLHRCDGKPNQAWRFERGRFVNVANGRCLDLHGPDAGFDGGRIQTVNCSNAPNQAWRHERGALITRADGRCLEAYGRPGSQGDEDDRALLPVHSWECRGTPGQQWRIALQAPPVPPAPPPPPPPPPPQPPQYQPVARDVEAGPIWDNDFAARRCPQVCAPGRWNGQWRTTVQGRMSVCGCISEAGGIFVEPPSPRPMPAPRFDDLLRAIGNEPFGANKLNLIDAAAREHLLTMGQLRRLVQTLPFPRDRLRAVEIVAPRLVDRMDRTGDAELYSAFDFEWERRQAREILERVRGGK
jgi:hypothetical protein